MVTALHGSLGLVGAPLLLLCATAADGRGRPVVAHLLRAVAMAAAAVAALGVIGHGQLQAPLGAWLELGRLQLVVGLHADSLGALALGAVTVQAFVFPFSCPAADGGGPVAAAPGAGAPPSCRPWTNAADVCNDDMMPRMPQ